MVYPEDEHEQFEEAKRSVNTLLIFCNRQPVHQVYLHILEVLEADIKTLQKNVESRKPYTYSIAIL